MTYLKILGTLLVIIFVASVGFSQDPTPTPEPSPTASPDPNQAKLDELKRLKELADALAALEEAKKKAEDAERARIKAALPTSSTTALDGSVAFDDKVVFTSQKLSYDALDTIASSAAPSINQAGADMIVVLGDPEIRALQSYGQTLAQIRGLSIQYINLNRSSQGGFEFGAAALGMIPEVATAFTKSIIDFASLFKTDVNIKGLEFSMETQSVSAALARSGVKNIYDPSFLPPKLTRDLVEPSTGQIASDSPILQALSNLIKSRNNAARILATHDSKTADAKTKDDPGRLNSLLFAPLNTQVDQFLSDLVATDAAGNNKLTALIAAENVKTLLAEAKKPHIMRLAVIKSAGTNTTKKNLFTGTKLNFSGGVIIRYCLFDAAGKMISSACATVAVENRDKLKL